MGRAQWDTGSAKEACRCKQEAGLDSLQLLEVTQRLSRHSLGPPCSWSGAEPALQRQTHKAHTLLIKKAVGRCTHPAEAESEQRAIIRGLG